MTGPPPQESSRKGERDWHTSRGLAAVEKREGQFDRSLPKRAMLGVHMDRGLPAHQDRESEMPVLHPLVRFQGKSLA